MDKIFKKYCVVQKEERCPYLKFLTKFLIVDVILIVVIASAGIAMIIHEANEPHPTPTIVELND